MLTDCVLIINNILESNRLLTHCVLIINNMAKNLIFNCLFHLRSPTNLPRSHYCHQLFKKPDHFRFRAGVGKLFRGPHSEVNFFDAHICIYNVNSYLKLTQKTKKVFFLIYDKTVGDEDKKIAAFLDKH